MSEIGTIDSIKVVSDAYILMSKYTAKTRSFPGLVDGFKSVYRRTLYANRNQTQMTKSARMIGTATPLHPHEQCLSGDTLVYTLDSKLSTIESLYKSGKKEFSVLAYDDETGKVTSAKLHSIRIGQVTEKLYTIHLSNGSSIKCTGNHPFMNEQGQYVKVEDINRVPYRLKYFSGFTVDNDDQEVSRPRLLDKIHSQISQVIDYMIDNGVELTSLNYNESVCKVIDTTSVNNLQNLSSSEFNMILSEYRRYRTYIQSITVEDVEPTVTYDFTVDKYENMLLPIVGDKLTSFIVCHNSSIYSVIVNLACKYTQFPILNSQGNMGGLGYEAAAERYTEACVSELCKLLYLDLVDYADYEEAETEGVEPTYLPALIPYMFLAGSSGMSVGLPTTNIPPMNSLDLVNFYLDYLNGRPTTYPRPDYGDSVCETPVNEWEDLLRTGYGRVDWAAHLYLEDEDKVVVLNQPPTTSIDRALSKLKPQLDSELVDFNDETTDKGYRFVFRVNNPRKFSRSEMYQIIDDALAGRQTYRFIVEYKTCAYKCGFDYIIKKQVEYLRTVVSRKFTHDIEVLDRKIKVLEAVSQLRNDVSTMTRLGQITSEELRQVIEGYGFSLEISKEVVSKSISYLTKSHDNEIIDLKKSLEEATDFRDNPDKYLIGRYEKLKVFVEDIYNSRMHSIFKESDGVVSISGTGTVVDLGVNEEFQLDSRGVIYSPNETSSKELVGSLISPRHKYLVVISENTSKEGIGFTVREISKLSLGQRVFTGEDYRVIDALGIDDEVFRMTNGSETVDLSVGWMMSDKVQTPRPGNKKLLTYSVVK